MSGTSQGLGVIIYYFGAVNFHSAFLTTPQNYWGYEISPPICSLCGGTGYFLPHSLIQNRGRSRPPIGRWQAQQARELIYEDCHRQHKMSGSPPPWARILSYIRGFNWVQSHIHSVHLVLTASYSLEVTSLSQLPAWE